MTLIVIDQYRTTADTYCRVTDAQGSVEVQDDYPKVFQMPYRVRLDDGTETFTTVAFCGDPRTFTELYQQFPSGEAGSVVDLNDLLAITATHNPGDGRVLIPRPNGVLVLPFSGGAFLAPESREGEIFAFGSAYSFTPNPYTQEEGRVWYSIFLDAIHAGDLPGDHITFLPHSEHSIEGRTALEGSVKPRRKKRGLLRDLRNLKTEYNTRRTAP